MSEVNSLERILVIDDDENICRTMQMIFNAYGYKTEYVHTGKNALEYVTNKQFSLAIIDVKLPDFEGTYLIDQLLELSPDLQIIMITGHASIESAVTALNSGATGYITKPLDMDEVLNIVSNVIERQKLIHEKKQAEDALIESEIWFRNIFNDSPIGIELLDDHGCIIDINTAAMTIFGVSDIKQLIGFDVLKDPNTPEYVKECIRKRRPYRFESTFYFNLVEKNKLYETPKSGIIYLDTVLTPLGPKDKEHLTGTMIQFQDITDQKKAESSLRESEEKWRSYTQDSPDHITIIDCNLNIQFSNRPSKGLAFEDLLGKCILDFLPNNQVEYVRNALTDLIKTGNPITYDTTYCAPDGLFIYYETRAIPRVIDNEIVGALLSSRDITDRKLAEERIQYQADLLQNISDAVISEDLESKIKSWNKAAEELYGWTSEEAIGEQTAQLLHNEYSGMTCEEILNVLSETGTWNGQIAQITKDGSNVDILTAVSYLYDTNRNPIGVVKVNRDITELISAQRDLQSERDRAMLYLDLMGHDIRNKLQAITMGLDVIETLLHDDATLDMFSAVQAAAEKCSQIISTVKRTEKLTEVPLEPRNLSEAIVESIEDFFGGVNNIEVKVNDKAADGQILGDQFLNDMIISLLENAVVHNTHERKKVWVNLEKSKSEFLLSISDNGPGLSDERKKYLFDKTRRYGGIGLHQVRNIVDKYHGRIEVADRITGIHESGAKFQIRLPIYKGTN